MNLYVIAYSYTMVTDLGGSMDVYIVAPDSAQAEKEALKEMGKLKYKINEQIGRIELVASTDDPQECLLVVAD